MHTLWVIRTQCMMCITCVLYTEKRSSSYEWSPGWIFHNPHKCRLERVKKKPTHILFSSLFYHLLHSVCFTCRTCMTSKKKKLKFSVWMKTAFIIIFFCMFQFFFFFLSRSSSNDATDRVSMPNIAPKNRLFLRIYFFFSILSCYYFFNFSEQCVYT